MDNYKPEWTPDGAGEEFACSVMPGIEDAQIAAAREQAVSAKPKGRRNLTVDEYVEGILACDRTVLSRAITIIESSAPKHFELGQQIIQKILPYTGKAVRVGITGVPGAGKSTLIEALGNQLCNDGHKIAVLAVDPSSSVSNGSVLGDKTRMETLSRRPEAFIRPSPSGGTLGGVTRKSRETMMLCEAAGFDTILIETVGVGQNEITVRSMVDFFLVVVITGAGDDLQGIKKGIIEIADAILVNKADGDNILRARATRAEYEQILHYLRPATAGWYTQAYTCSARTGDGIREIWEVVEKYVSQVRENGILEDRREKQTLSWVKQITEEAIRNRIMSNPRVQQQLEVTEKQLATGTISATMAAQGLILAIEEELRKPDSAI